MTARHSLDQIRARPRWGDGVPDQERAMSRASLCSIHGCGKSFYARGLCNTHYKRLLRNGDPLAVREGQGGAKKSIRPRVDPDISILRKTMEYDPLTGELRWKETKEVHGPVRGKLAGCVKTNGYLGTRIGDKIHLNHRLAWAIHFGEWPKDCIDHVNQIKTDNRLINLREASVAENNRNRGVQRNNSSGFRGVKCYGDGKYEAVITHNKKTYRLGSFSSPEDAAAAYQNKAAELHGAFASSVTGGGNGR